MAAARSYDDPGLVIHVVGARPNFIKMAPLIETLRQRGVNRQLVVHTGQHYDRRMSEEILADLGFPKPDHSLGVGSGPHGEQTAKVLMAFEEILMERRPAVVVVAGDVNSTLACALAASKLGIPIVHLEAGLRSGDWSMPEEINRVLTDRLSDLLLTHSPEAAKNLEAEGVDVSRVRYVGNTMIDSLRRFEGQARERAAWRAHGLELGEYVLVTLHRPSNVDEPNRLSEIVTALAAVGSEAPIIFPVHPRTRARLVDARLLERLDVVRRALHRSGWLSRLPLASGGRRGDRHRLGRSPGGGLRPRRRLLHAARQHRAAGDHHPRHQRLARGYARGAASRAPVGSPADALRHPALGRARS